MEERRRLTRDRENRMLGGVCAGIARRYDYDVTVVRIIFALLAFFSGLGIILYLVMWLLLPPDERVETPTRQVMRDNVDEMTERAREAAEAARAAADAARQAADQLAEATRAAVAAGRESWQQGSRQRSEPGPNSEYEPEVFSKPGETTPEGSGSTWPPDRPLPETGAQPEEPRQGSGSANP